MTTSILAAAGKWTTAATADLPVASSWSGQADGAVLVTDASGDRVIVAGGSDGTSTGALAKSAQYNPTDNKWTALADMKAARRLHSITALPGGKILVIGGLPSGAQFPSAGLPTAEVYDPTEGKKTWELVTSMPKPRWGHSAVLLKDKKTVLVTGGTTLRSGSSERALNTAELYDIDQKTWKPAATMTDARSGHTSILLDDKVLVIGGSVPIRQDDPAALAYCEIYDPGTDTWQPTGNLTEPRSNHQAVLVGSKVLAVGGNAPGMTKDGGFDPFSRRTAELYDINARTWSPVTNLLPGGRSLHRAVALGTTKALVIGGTGGARSDSGYEKAFLLDVGTQAWQDAGALTTGRWAFAAAALSDGKRVVITGGIARAGLTAADENVAELTASTEVFTLGGGS